MRMAETISKLTLIGILGLSALSCGGEGSIQGFSIVATQPPAGSEAQDPHVEFSATFDRALNPSDAAGNFVLIDAENGRPVDGTVRLEESGAKLVFDSAEALRPGGRYIAKLLAELRDTEGNRFGSPYEWLVQIQEQTLLAGIHVVPHRAQQNVNPGAVIRVEFPADMDPSSITPQSLQLTQSGISVAATVSYDERGWIPTAYLHPIDELSRDAEYTLQVAGSVATAAGQTLNEPIVSTFRTASLPRDSIQFGDAGRNAASAVAIDSVGNLFVLEHHSDYRQAADANGPLIRDSIRKFSRQKTRVWDVTPISDPLVSLNTVVTTNDDDIIVAGWGTGAGFNDPPFAGGSAAAVLKLSGTDGRTAWIRKDMGQDLAAVNAIVVDTSGNVYIAGYTNDALVVDAQGKPSNIVVAKLDASTGATLWINQLDTPGSDAAATLALNQNATITLAWVSEAPFVPVQSSTAAELFIAQMSAETGSIRNQRSSPLGEFETPPRLAITAAQVIVASGNRNVTTDVLDTIVRSYDLSSGDLRWQTALGFSYYGAPTSVATDRTGNMYIAGFTVAYAETAGDPAHNGGFITRISDVDGAVVWQRIVSAEKDPHAVDTATARTSFEDLKIDAGGNVVVTGSIFGSGFIDGFTSFGSGDAFVVTLTSAGEFLLK